MTFIFFNTKSLLKCYLFTLLQHNRQNNLHLFLEKILNFYKFDTIQCNTYLFIFFITYFFFIGNLLKICLNKLSIYKKYKYA